MRQISFSSNASVISISAATSLLVWVALTILQPALRVELQRSRVPFSSSVPTTTTLLSETEESPTLKSEEEQVIQLVKKAQPAVVAVMVYSNIAPPRMSEFLSPDDPFAPFFAPPRLRGDTRMPQKRRVGGGSGFFVSSDGILATNRHVIDFEDAEFEIVTHEGKKYIARLLGKDPVLDVAFLKVDGSGFPSVRFADSDTLKPGQTVIAIGNALDEFRNTITKGIVSGLNRRIVAGDGFTNELIEEAIQTDAAINPGNSGGPLLDLSGNVVGLNTAMSQNAQLLGFALPSNTVLRDLKMMQKLGKIVRPFLGVRYQMITEDLVKKNQLTVDHGALILRGSDRGELAISPGSPADKAGLVENDIILEVNGAPVTEEHSLSSLLRRSAPGDEVTLKILHTGAEKTVKVTLQEMK